MESRAGFLLTVLLLLVVGMPGYSAEPGEGEIVALSTPVFADEKEKKDEGWVDLLSAKTKSLDDHWTRRVNLFSRTFRPIIQGC